MLPDFILKQTFAEIGTVCLVHIFQSFICDKKWFTCIFIFFFLTSFIWKSVDVESGLNILLETLKNMCKL